LTLNPDWGLPTSGATAQSTGASGTITPPTGARACYINVAAAAAQSAYITFDGSTPSSSNGIEIAKGTNPVYFGLAATIKWVGIGGNSTVNVQWLA
jgi:hypothetical protein